MSRASTLFRLQEIDIELDAHRARLGTIEQALSSSPAVLAAQQQVLRSRDAFNAARVRVRTLELEAQTHGEKIADAERRLYSGAITNPKELRDLEQDLASLRRRRSAAEEQELEGMIAAETTEGEMVAAQTRLQQAEAEALQTQGNLLEERRHLQQRAAQLAGEREAVAGSVSAEDLVLYQRLRQSKRQRPVARLEEGNCAACGEEMSSASIHEARRGAALVRCTGCERILYVD